jgi:uncharacterized membrane protein YqaE (UPF0057 family)
MTGDHAEGGGGGVSDLLVNSCLTLLSNPPAPFFCTYCSSQMIGDHAEGGGGVSDLLLNNCLTLLSNPPAPLFCP